MIESPNWSSGDESDTLLASRAVPASRLWCWGVNVLAIVVVAIALLDSWSGGG